MSTKNKIPQINRAVIIPEIFLYKVPHYIGAQYLGSLTASLTVFLAYWDSLVWYEHDRGEYR